MPANKTKPTHATSDELAKYENRAKQYYRLAFMLKEFAMAINDPQVRSMCGQWSEECRLIARQWVIETRGGL